VATLRQQAAERAGRKTELIDVAVKLREKFDRDHAAIVQECQDADRDYRRLSGQANELDRNCKAVLGSTGTGQDFSRLVAAGQELEALQTRRPMLKEEIANAGKRNGAETLLAEVEYEVGQARKDSPRWNELQAKAAPFRQAVERVNAMRTELADVEARIPEAAAALERERQAGPQWIDMRWDA
jgi:hypothetical protein